MANNKVCGADVVQGGDIENTMYEKNGEDSFKTCFLCEGMDQIRSAKSLSAECSEMWHLLCGLCVK